MMTAPTEVAVGASLRFLAEVAWLALDLVGRGRVLPALVDERGGLAARWRPVVTGEDAERLRALAVAMPPACRAERRGRISGDVRRDAEAVSEGRFYIFSHPHALGAVQTRLEDIMRVRNPSDPFKDRPEIGAQLRRAIREA